MARWKIIHTNKELPRKVSARELLDIREDSWSGSLRGRSLVTEFDIRSAHSIQVAKAFGRIYQRLAVPAQDGPRVLRRWPACLAGAMTGVAISGYQAGSYWPALWEAADYPGTQADQVVWGSAFAAALERLGLPTFPGMSLPYVGPILMHAGIPTYCLGDLFELLIERSARDPGLDAESFHAWAVGGEHRLNQLDVPARRFLVEGGEYALDTVDRCIDLLDRLRETDPDLDGVVLPDRFVEEARRAVHEGRIDPSPMRRKAPGRQERPRIALDPYGQGVCVILPAIGDALDGIALWRLIADGAPATVRSRAPWVGVSEAAPESTYALPRPVRIVMVSLQGSDAEMTLGVVDQHDPLLIFSEDGRLLPARLSLPPDPVWVLYPSDREVVVQGSLRTMAEVPVPFGWDGWQLRLVSLEQASSVALDGQRPRAVRGHARPRVLLGEPVPGVTTAYGSTVYAEPPLIWLPAASESAVRWRIEVRSNDTGNVIASRSCEVEEATDIDIWEGCHRPLLGSFDVIVRGPLGRGARRSVYLAEGLAAHYAPALRWFTSAGLGRCQAELSAPPGVRVTPAVLAFDPGQTAQAVEYGTAWASEPLVIRPPQMSALWDRGGSTRWTFQPLSMTTEAFTDPGGLLVRIPGTTESPPLEVRILGQTVQTLTADAQGAPDLARYDLRRISDTVAAHNRAELMLLADGRSIPVAFVRPRRVASRIEHEQGVLRLRDYVPVEGLVAAVYQRYAPWREPVVLSVERDGTIPLPVELRDSGPMHVLLRMEDPWVSDEWPRWPGEDALVCSAPGVPGGDDAEELALSRFVAGTAQLPNDCDRLERLWRLAELGDELDLYEQCGSVLRNRPALSLESLGESGLGLDECVVALVATGMASAMSDGPSSPDAAARLWSSLPAPAAILTSRVLPRLGAAPQDSSEVELWATIVAQCGTSIRAIIEGEKDPHAGVGRFGSDAERMATLPSEQLESVWRAAHVVPRAFLDADNRMVAARQLFDSRRRPEAKGLAYDATAAVRSALQLLEAAPYHGLVAQVEARRHPDHRGGWLALPAMSIALALAARVAARECGGFRVFEQHWRARWSGLARLAPGLVAIDLILAEAMLAAQESALYAEESA